MAKVIVRLNSRGVRELISSPEAQAEIMGRSRAVQQAAGDGHSVLNTTTNRARAHVRTESKEAAEANATGHTLIRAINAARG